MGPLFWGIGAFSLQGKQLLSDRESLLRRKVAEGLAAGIATVRPGRKPPESWSTSGGRQKGGDAQAQRGQAQHRGQEGGPDTRQGCR